MFVGRLPDRIDKKPISEYNIKLKENNKPYVRRIDILYSTPKEYPFTIMYFTGSMEINTIMRKRALEMNLTLNEHGLCHMVNKKKGDPIDKEFKTEKEIFEYLGIKYLEPTERIDNNSIKNLSFDEKK